MVAFVRNCVVAVLVDFCCYEYGANASEAVHKIRTRTPLELCQLIKTAHFKAIHLWKNIFSSLLPPPYWRYKPGFCFFSWQIKMSNLLHIGLILIISKVLTILCLLCLCRNREYPGKFQNETVISKYALLSNECPSKLRGKDFLKWTRSIDLSSKLSLTYI